MANPSLAYLINKLWKSLVFAKEASIATKHSKEVNYFLTSSLRNELYQKKEKSFDCKRMMHIFQDTKLNCSYLEKNPIIATHRCKVMAKCEVARVRGEPISWQF